MLGEGGTNAPSIMSVFSLAYKMHMHMLNVDFLFSTPLKA